MSYLKYKDDELPRDKEAQGEWIYELVEKCGMRSLSEFARFVGVAPSTLTRVISPVTPNTLSYATMCKISRKAATKARPVGSVPVIGHLVGPGAIEILEPGEDDPVGPSPLAQDELFGAVIVKATSSWPMYRLGDVIYLGRPARTASELVGNEVVIQLANDELALIGYLYRAEGSPITLLRHNLPPTPAIMTMWAAPVLYVSRFVCTP